LRINTTAAAAAPSTQKVLLKASRSTNTIEHLSLPSLCGNVVTEPSKLFPSSQPIPEGFLCLNKAKEEASTGTAPLGLKLRKSDSLLNLINSTLSTNNNATTTTTTSGGSEGTAIAPTAAAVGGEARSI
jgi:hypothetical protein